MKMYQCDATSEGIVIDTEVSQRVSNAQRIVLDYLYLFAYPAAPGDLVQVDTYGVTATDRKTLVYAPYPVTIAGYSTNLNIELDAGEYFQCYTKGGGANSKMCAIVWYHIEDVNQPANSFNQQVQPCGLIPWLQGRCSS